MPILPQIVYDELDMLYLSRSESGYIKRVRCGRFLHITAQQVVCADMKEVRNSYQHIYRGHDVVVFPITDALLFNAQPFRKLNLIQLPRQPQVFDTNCKHK